MSETSDWQRYPEPGERVLWQGRPSRRLFVFRPVELVLIPVPVAWALLAVAGTIPMLGADPLSGAFALVFPGAAFHFTIGRFLLDLSNRKRTVSALTNKRALIAGSGFGRRLRVLPITPAMPVGFKDAPRGSVWLDERPGLTASVRVPPTP